MASFKFNNVYINDFYTIVGPLEKEGHIKEYNMDMNDYYFGEKTFEQAEIKMQKVSFENLLKKNKLQNKDISLVISSDLNNQLLASNYAINNTNIPFLGIYSACASFCESIIISSIFLNSGLNKIVSNISSHNLTSERQFRYPVEYGALKKHTSTFTVTASISTLLSKKSGKIKVESATIGRVVDSTIKDSSKMGGVMAIAAVDTLYNHLNDFKRKANYYDLILTGDLGCIGHKIFVEYYKNTYNMDLTNTLDAGCELYLDSQKTYNGGSGPACLPLILFNKIIKKKKYKKILIIATGSLHSKTSTDQKLSIPSIAHAVSLEVL